MEEEAEPLCPSFNIYYNRRFAEIAAKVADEKYPLETSTDCDDDFEFAFVSIDSDVTADYISREGKIGQISLILNRDHLIRYDRDQSDGKKPTELTLGLPFERFFFDDAGEERELCPPSSSEEEDADELESVPAGTYCIWWPEVDKQSASRHKKSNSTGSALKHCNLRELLLHRRSNSVGKEHSFMFLTTKNREQKAPKLGKFESLETPNAGKKKVKAKGVAGAGEKLSSHEVFYVRNRAWKEGEKRKSFLPYRKDLGGFFAILNAFGFGKTFYPF